jgi:hypothetical protein
MNTQNDDAAERRVHSRLDRVHKLFLQVADDGVDAPRLLRCACENVSPSGLGLTVVDPLVVGTRVELWVNVEDLGARFLLGGTVRWCRPAAYRGLSEIGVELDRGRSEEMERWISLWAREAVPGE